MNITFEWTPDISVGDAMIDSQHKELLAQVNTLIEVIAGNKDEVSLNNILTFLDTYIAEHFSYEEEYMNEHQYPDREQHVDIHKHFAEDYKKLKEKLREEGFVQESILEIEKRLGSWWINHIGKEDKKYALWVEKHINHTEQ